MHYINVYDLHIDDYIHGPLNTRYVKWQVAHAPGMSRTFSPAAEFKGNRELAIPTCITARASSPCRDVCRDCLPAVAGKTMRTRNHYDHSEGGANPRWQRPSNRRPTVLHVMDRHLFWGALCGTCEPGQHQTSNISRTKSQNLIVSRLVLQFCLCPIDWSQVLSR